MCVCVRERERERQRNRRRGGRKCGEGQLAGLGEVMETMPIALVDPQVLSLNV